MINYIKDLISRINRLFYQARVAWFNQEKLINDLKMRELENKQKQELIDELIAKLKPEPNYTDFQPVGKDGLCINPFWQVRVSHFGETVTAMPFLYYIHSHLKRYGFDPDNKLRDKGLEINIAMRMDENGKLDEGFVVPFYIKSEMLPDGDPKTGQLANLDPGDAVIKNKKTGQIVKQKDLIK